MSVYVVAERTIDECDTHGHSDVGLRETFQRHRGEVLAMEEEPRVIEGEWKYRHTALLRFPDASAAERWAREPEIGPWAPGYYLILVEDPDGIRVEVITYPGASTSAA